MEKKPKKQLALIKAWSTACRLSGTNTNLVAAFLLCDSISCFRHSIPSMVSGSDSAPPLLGNVADASRREDASPLSLPGPFTDSDSEPCGWRESVNCGEWVKTEGWMDVSEWAEKQPIAAKHEKPSWSLLGGNRRACSQGLRPVINLISQGNYGYLYASGLYLE